MKQILLVEDDEIMRITLYDRLMREKWAPRHLVWI